MDYIIFGSEGVHFNFLPHIILYVQPTVSDQLAYDLVAIQTHTTTHCFLFVVSMYVNKIQVRGHHIWIWAGTQACKHVMCKVQNTAAPFQGHLGLDHTRRLVKSNPPNAHTVSLQTCKRSPPHAPRSGLLSVKTRSLGARSHRAGSRQRYRVVFAQKPQANFCQELAEKRGRKDARASGQIAVPVDLDSSEGTLRAWGHGAGRQKAALASSTAVRACHGEFDKI